MSVVRLFAPSISFISVAKVGKSADDRPHPQRLQWKYVHFKLGCFRRKRRGIVIALASVAAAVSAAAASCEIFDIF